ncbi:MAG: FAD-dependent oxidoreductase [Thermodesulfobacteriota bacterium]|nr:FAD-dependent oxidoreductase [Thermodesulfobacteriota bacterium]
MVQHLIIGGSDAGISAALRIKVLAPKACVTVMAADAYPNFSICGLPFFLNGEVTDGRTLAHRTVDDIITHGIDLLLNHKAMAIDPDARQVRGRPADGKDFRIEYGNLLMATGNRKFQNASTSLPLHFIMPCP